jgi:PAS domain S-box-containing protein
MIIESMPLGLLILGERGTIEVINPASESLFGYDLNDITSRLVSEMFVNLDVTASELLVRLSAAGEEDGRELEALKRTGETFPAQVIVKSFESFEGLRYLMLVVDISEKREIERMKQEFVAIVSHDLRAPLTSLQGFLDMIGLGAFGELPDKLKDRAEIASRSIGRLIDLINSLLDLEKIEAGKLDFQFKQTSMPTVVGIALDAVGDMARTENVEIKCAVKDVQLEADGERLAQALINLLSNAIKYSPPGGMVLLTCEDQGALVEVAVSDQGAGVAPEDRELIFEKYRQGRTAPLSKQKGTGLGLPICKAIVDEHGVMFGVTGGDNGRGSRFWFRLPKTQVERKSIQHSG